MIGEMPRLAATRNACTREWTGARVFGQPRLAGGPCPLFLGSRRTGRVTRPAG